jgi:hypothetical protein
MDLPTFEKITSFGKRVAYLRNGLDLSIHEFASGLEMSDDQVRNWEKRESIPNFRDRSKGTGELCGDTRRAKIRDGLETLLQDLPHEEIECWIRAFFRNSIQGRPSKCSPWELVERILLQPCLPLSRSEPVAATPEEILRELDRATGYVPETTPTGTVWIPGPKVLEGENCANQLADLSIAAWCIRIRREFLDADILSNRTPEDLLEELEEGSPCYKYFKSIVKEPYRLEGEVESPNGLRAIMAEFGTSSRDEAWAWGFATQFRSRYRVLEDEHPHLHQQILRSLYGVEEEPPSEPELADRVH